ncbi:MAG: SGNH hydrolase [Spirochaetes bacterium]|nr:SGNH hydrolase [Spirochaetota bacterium]
MTGKVKKILAFSLVLNALFIAAALFFFYKGYPRKIIKPFLRDYYLNKLSHFQSLGRKEGQIVFLGDSLTDRCEWAELLGRCDVVNRGIDADTTDGVIQRLGEITEMKPAKVFIMIGGNDFVIGRSVNLIEENYKTIVGRILSESPGTRVYIQSNIPTVYRLVPLERKLIIELNRRLAAMADNRRVFFIDIYSHMVDKKGDLNAAFTLDGAHLNGQGYLVWRESIYKYLK